MKKQEINKFNLGLKIGFVSGTCVTIILSDYTYILAHKIYEACKRRIEWKRNLYYEDKTKETFFKRLKSKVRGSK